MNRLVAIFLLCAAMTWAQTNRGAITGTVTDATGGLIPGAKVTIINKGTNETRTVTTTDIGAFTSNDMEPVDYWIEVQAEGFKRTVVDNVKVDTASTASVAIKMETGSIDTKVEVSADAVMINTDNGTLSSTINTKQIESAPLLNRSVLDLALTLPNVGGDPGSENPGITAGTPCPGCGLSVGGGRPLSTMIMADGTNNTGISLARSMVSFTPET